MNIKDKLRKIKDYPFGLYLWNEYRRIQGIRDLKNILIWNL